MRDQDLSCSLGAHQRVDDGSGYWHCAHCGTGLRRSLRPRLPGWFWYYGSLLAILLGVCVALMLDRAAHHIGYALGVP
jgi:hypothetical protein